MVSITWPIGVIINGANPDPIIHRLSPDYAWYAAHDDDGAHDLAAPSGGGVTDPDAAATGRGPADGPNLLAWTQSGAPFGSVQTQFAITSGALPKGVRLVHKEVRAMIPGGFNPWPVGVLNQFGFDGVPLEEGVFTCTVGASGAFGGETYQWTIVRNALPPESPDFPGTCPVISIPDLAPIYVGPTYDFTIEAEGGEAPYVYDVPWGELPDGLTLEADGQLHGTPTTVGVFTFYIRATDDFGCIGVRKFSGDEDTPGGDVILLPRTQIRGDTQIKPATVTEKELNPSVAGAGLVGGAGVPLAVNPSATGGLEIAADALKLKLDGPTLTIGAGGAKVSPGIFIRKDGTEVFTADQSLGGFKLTNGATPTASTDFVIKSYVDALALGVQWKTSVRFVTTANDSLTGLAARNGVTPVAGDRVGVIAQTTGSQNGVYIAAAGAWTRATDFDADSEVKAGASFMADEGTVGADKMYVLTTNDPIVVGTTALSFSSITAGLGDIKSDGSVPFAANQSMGNNRLTSVADPTSAQDAVNLRTLEGIDILMTDDTTTPEFIFGADGSVIFTGI